MIWRIYGAIQSCILSASDLVGVVVTILVRTGFGMECTPGDGVHGIAVGGILVLGKAYCDGRWGQVAPGRYTEVGGYAYDSGGIIHSWWSGMNSIRTLWAADWANWSNGA